MPSRARNRVGRRVRYHPTAANITARGAGDYVGQITKVTATDTTIDVTGPDGVHFVVTTADFGSQPGQFDYFGGVSA